MITTDEPGLYIDGSHGIRLENELLCVERQNTEYGRFLGFDCLTLAPIDLDAIDPSLLTEVDRQRLNILELVVEADADAGPVVITDEKVTERLQQNPLAYDKDGEMHYDIISAFIKSIRGSDPDGALYWLARMVEAGEDPAFIARRLVISAAEDIGLANPNALLLANAAFDAVMKIGWPEGRIPLAEATVYLATSPKSNSAYEGINSALELVRQTGNLPVPLHLRNAPTKLMKQLGYGKDYKYAHAYQGNFVQQQFLPDEVKDSRIWHPQNNAQEAKIKERMQSLWGERFKE